MKLLKKLVTFVGLSFAAVIGLVCAVSLAMIAMAFHGGVGGDSGSLDEVTSERAVSVVDLTGEIITSEKFLASLKKQVENDKIKGIVVRIDSPGGAVGASEEIYRAIRKAVLKKPVVCALGSIAASGGLYSAVGCQKIVTNAGTLTGSIGVIMMSPNFSGIMKQVGVDMTVVKSGKYKDSGSPFREQTVEDRELIQSIVNTAYGQFVKIIADSRNLPLDKVKQFADGRIILGEDAVKLGLVDEIGGVDRAAKLALELAKIEGEPEIMLQPKSVGIMSLFREMPESRLFSFLRSFSASGLRYEALL